MAITITVRDDNAIVIYDEDDPRYGVVLDTVAQAASLIAALNATVTRLHGQDAFMSARMRAVAEAAGDFGDRLN